METDCPLQNKKSKMYEAYGHTMILRFSERIAKSNIQTVQRSF